MRFSESIFVIMTVVIFYWKSIEVIEFPLIFIEFPLILVEMFDHHQCFFKIFNQNRRISKSFFKIGRIRQAKILLFFQNLKKTLLTLVTDPLQQAAGRRWGGGAVSPLPCETDPVQNQDDAPVERNYKNKFVGRYIRRDGTGQSPPNRVVFFR